MSPKSASPDLALDQVTADYLDQAWPHCEPLLQRGINAVTTTRTTDEIYRWVRSGHYQLWTIADRATPLPVLASAATCLRETIKGRTAVIDTIGGHDMHLWLEPMLAEFAVMARAKGAVRLEVEGRVGWARALQGFRVVRVVLERDLQ